MPIDFVSHVRSESARFADALATADPHARVPTCPDWTAADLLWHLAEVQLFWDTIVRERLDDPRRAEIKPVRPSNYDALRALFAAASAALVDTLAGTAADVAVWTWFDADQSVGFVRRRQAHEALIHRLDAELVTGSVTGFDAELATDGVSEVLDWMYSEVPAWATHELDDTVGELTTTDTRARWLVRIGHLSGTDPETGRSYTDHPTLIEVGDGQPSFAVTAAARDLDAWLWNRPTLGPVERHGDYAAFEQIIRSGVQ